MSLACPVPGNGYLYLATPFWILKDRLCVDCGFCSYARLGESVMPVEGTLTLVKIQMCTLN